MQEFLYKVKSIKSGKVRKEIINMEIPLKVFQAKTLQKVHSMEGDFFKLIKKKKIHVKCS